MKFLPGFCFWDLNGRNGGSLSIAGGLRERAIAAALPRAASAPAENLHKNTQTLNALRKCAANGPCIVRAWQKSFPFNSSHRGCRGGF
jgi:hypothetical protein